MVRGPWGEDVIGVSMTDAIAAMRAKRDNTTNPSYQRQLDATIHLLESAALDVLPRVKAERDRYRDTLRWYADDERYRGHYPEALRDTGERAREALVERPM